LTAITAQLGRATDGVPAWLLRAAAWVVAGLVLGWAFLGYFEPTKESLASGIPVGALYGLIAVGVILIYRTNKIINFAVAAIGAVPAVTGVLLVTAKGQNYFVGLAVAVLGGPILGAIVDFVVIRRFSQAPRLILTVATIGIAQIFAFIGIYLPIWFGSDEGVSQKLVSPWSDFRVENAQGTLFFDGDYVFAVALVIAMAAALAVFFRYTRLGIALRAAAENADRAALLGIPVRRVQTAAWMIAGLFGSMTIYARSSLVGVPTDGSLGYSVLLFALAAAVLARMNSIPIAVGAGIVVGMIEFAAVGKAGDNDFATAVMFAIILAALLVQRGKLSRAQDSGVSSWQTLQEYRPVPSELRKVPEVVGARVALALAVVALLVFLPSLVSRGEVALLAALPIAGIVAASLVILTGWAGQISLGQYALVGAGAVVAGKLSTEFADTIVADFWMTLGIGAVAGALVAVLVGMPAVRIQGLFLAVTTLSLAGAAQNYFFNRGETFGELIMPSREARIERPILWERIDLTSERTMYYVCLVFLAGAVYAASRFRHSRSGRVLIAVRENQRAAPSYAINLVRTRLAAFAVSGAIAAIAGVLLAYQQRAVDPSTYGIAPSVKIFVSTVMGGLTSLPGAVFGSMLIEGVYRFGESRLDGISLLVTGPGLLVILLFLPGGFAQAGYGMRDAYLRWVANRRGIHVPSLVADRRIDPEEEAHVVAHAEENVEAVEALAGAGARA
jgi:branched-chain amino acid transport system permease protein